MSIFAKRGVSRKGLSLLAPLAFLTLAACATPFRADVQRFVALPDTTLRWLPMIPNCPADSSSGNMQRWSNSG